MAVMRISLNSSVLKRKNDITVFLPIDLTEDYRKHVDLFKSGVKFQVLWLLHGGWGDDTDFRDYSNVLRYAAEHHLALIMPGGVDFYKSPYYEYVTEELPRQLCAMLPLSAEREDNFICGLSFGGDCALRTCLEHPDRYAAGLVMSAAGTDHHDKVSMRFDAFAMAQQLLDSGAEVPRLIFATGSGDRGFPFYVSVIDDLEKLGLPLQRHYVDGDGHSWDFWDATVKTAMEQWFPLKNAAMMPEQARSI